VESWRGLVYGVLLRKTGSLVLAAYRNGETFKTRAPVDHVCPPFSVVVVDVRLFSSYGIGFKLWSAPAQ